MKTLSVVGLVIGFFWCLLFGFRYLVTWPDWSAAVIFISIGGLFMAASWLFEKASVIGNKLDSTEDKVADHQQLLEENKLIPEGWMPE